MFSLPPEIIQIIVGLLDPGDYVSLLKTCVVLYDLCVEFIGDMKEKSCRRLLVYNDETGLNTECLVLPNNIIYKTLECCKYVDVVQTLYIEINDVLHCMRIVSSDSVHKQYINEVNIIGRRVSLYNKCRANNIMVYDSLILVNGLPSKVYRRITDVSYYLSQDDTKIYYASPWFINSPDTIIKRTGYISPNLFVVHVVI